MSSKTAFKFAILLTIAVAGPAMLGAQVQISSSPGGNIQIGGGGSGGAGGGQGCFVGSGGLVGAFTNGSGVIVETPVCIGGNGSISFAVPTGATQLQLGINDNKYTDDTGSFSINVAKNGGGASPVTVAATTMPWDPSTNPNFNFGQNDGTAPVVAITGLTEADFVTLTYVSGTVNVNPGGGAPNVNANGWLTIPPAAACSGGPTGTYNCGGFGIGPTYFMQGQADLAWPQTGSLLVSNGTSVPGALPEVDGDCAKGVGGVWATATCGGGGGAGTLVPTYWFYLDGSGNANALNGITGTVDYTNADPAVVWNDMVNNVVATYGTCGRINIISTNGNTGKFVAASTLTATDGSHYAYGIPAAAGGTNQYCDWVIEGDVFTGLRDQFGNPVQNRGVILDLSSAARSAVSSSTIVNVFYVLPNAGSGPANGVQIKNVTVRQSDNQRQHTKNFDLLNAASEDLSHVLADTDVAQSSLSPAVTDTIGITSTAPLNEENSMRFAYSSGFYTAFDFESEHQYIESTYALNCHDGFDYGVNGSAPGFPRVNMVAVSSGIVACTNGITFGSDVVAGSQFDGNIEMEDGTGSGGYLIAETTPGNVIGRINLAGPVVGSAQAALSTGPSNLCVVTPTDEVCGNRGGSTTQPGFTRNILSSASASLHSADLAPNLPSSGIVSNDIGVDTTNAKNAAQAVFVYAGSGSASNRYCFDFTSSSVYNLCMYPSGGVEFGESSPADPGASALAAGSAGQFAVSANGYASGPRNTSTLYAGAATFPTGSCGSSPGPGWYQWTQDGIGSFCNGSNWVRVSIPRIQITVASGSVAATCSGIGYTTASMNGLDNTMAVKMTPTTDVASVAGWDNGDVYFAAYASAAGTLSWKVCTTNPSGETLGASTTWNISAN